MSKKLNWILILVSIIVLIFAVYFFIHPTVFSSDFNEIKNDPTLGEKQKMGKGLALTVDVFMIKYFSLSFILTIPIILFLLTRNLVKSHRIKGEL